MSSKVHVGSFLVSCWPSGYWRSFMSVSDNRETGITSEADIDKYS